MALDITRYDVTIRLTEELLGTSPKSKEVYGNYIATKAAEHAERERKRSQKTGELPRMANGEEATEQAVAVQMEEQIASVQEIEEKGWTGFLEDEEGPFLLDYALRGFLGESARNMKQWGTIKQLADKFKRYVFVRPRRIRLPRPSRVENFAGKPLLIVTPTGLVCERPLRAATAMGPRVTVVRSDVVAAGAKLSFSLDVFDVSGIKLGTLRDILDYGQYQGLGQWRSASWGRFETVKLQKAA